MRIIPAALLLMALLSLSNASLCQWSNDPAVNTPVCTVANSGTNQILRSCSDGAGGVIMVWGDKRKELGNTGGDIFAQRLDAEGNPLWTPNGVMICDTTGEQNAPCIVSDDAGGAFIAWVDARTGQYTGNIYVQHIDASGQVQWERQGKKITTGANTWFVVAMARDGAGGAILAFRYGVTPAGIYAQRISATGAVMWAPAGVGISPAGYHDYPVVAADDSGGAYISWTFTRTDGLWNGYIQRITPGGVKRFAANGVPFRVQAGSQGQNKLVSLGGGQVMASWYDERAYNRQIFVQKFSWNGTPLLTAGGKAVTDPNIDAYYTVMSPDGAGGVFIAYWYSYSLRAVGVRGNGLVRWDSSAGVILCSAAKERYFGDIALVEPGRAVVAWHDNRNNDYVNYNTDLYAQTIDTLGQLGWTINGIPFCSAINTQVSPVLVPTVNRGAIAAWMDDRTRIGSTERYNPYAQRINAGGGLTSSEEQSLMPADFALLQNFPNPFNPLTRIEVRTKKSEFLVLRVFDLLGKEVATLLNEVKPPGTYQLEFDGAGLASGVYFCRLQAGEMVRVRKMMLTR